MPKKRIRKPAGTTSRRSNKGNVKSHSDVNHWLSDSLNKRLFAGVALGGGKTDKTCVALLEYYPDFKKIFLSDLILNIKSEGEVSSDLALHTLIQKHHRNLEYVAFNHMYSQWHK